MAESIVHINYVRKMVDYLSVLIPIGDRSLVLVDLPESSRKPDRTIGNFIPDLYYKNTGCLIIGEAKTENDIDRKHSIDQFESYIVETSLFNGESHIVICTSLYSFARIKNLIRRMKMEQNSLTIFHIIDDIERISII